MSEWLIRFDFPDLGPPYYAGKYKDSLGWAPTPATAIRFETQEAAEQMLVNGYLVHAECASIVQATDG